MSKEKLAAAKQFIQEQQYREARVILESTDHPKADEWLAKLPKLTQPEKLKNTSPRQNFWNSPVSKIIAIFVLLVTFMTGTFVGQLVATYEPPIRSLEMTKTAIHNENSTTEALIRATIASATEFTEQTQAITTQDISLMTPTMTLDPAFPTWTPTPE